MYTLYKIIHSLVIIYLYTLYRSDPYMQSCVRVDFGISISMWITDSSWLMYIYTLYCNTPEEKRMVSKYAAIHYNTLQHTATYCNILHHTTIYCKICNTLEEKRTDSKSAATYCNTLHHTVMHCNTLQCTATRCSVLLHTATHLKRRELSQSTLTGRLLLKRELSQRMMPHIVTHHNTLQHTATHLSRRELSQSNTLQ